MPLYVTEDEVRRLVDMSDSLTAVEAGFRRWGQGGTANLVRRRLPLPGAVYQTMAASLPDDVFGAKAYYVLPAGRNFTVFLHSLSEGRLLAMIEADWMSQLRTGAATGVAARYMARGDAARIGIIGAGTQARAQLIALAAVRKIASVAVYSRDAARRAAFAEAMSADLGVAVAPVSSPAACIDGADMVVTITNAGEPLFDGSALAPGCFVAAAGANRLARREIDVETVRRAAVVAVDDPEQARLESGELTAAVDAGVLGWDAVVPFGDIVTGRRAGRGDDADITLYKSLGIAIEDVAFAKTVYERALAAGAGEQFGGSR
jgi:ornithine cyclodeaminase/alanine dehydrogenase-like protein (mu-crystallin family)